MNAAEIDLGSICLSEITQFNTSFAERVQIKERVELQNQLRDINIAKREKLRDERLAQVGEQNRLAKKEAVVKKQTEHAQRLKHREDAHQERVEAKMAKEIEDKQFKELELRRGLSVNDKRAAMAKQERTKPGCRAC